MPVGNRDSSELHAVGVSIPPIDDAQGTIVEIVRAALNEERATGVPVSEEFVERICTALTPDRETGRAGIRKALLTLALHEYMDGRASAAAPMPVSKR